jgi:hypothetical protein
MLKKHMIQEKMKELRRQGKSVAEVYKLAEII